MTEYTRKFYKCDIRDPYTGNTIPLIVQLVWDQAYFLTRVKVTQGEGITVNAESIELKDIPEMFIE